jgi:hypothetical protein
LGAVQKQFEDVECADDRRYHAGHVDSPFEMPNPASTISTRTGT